MSNTRIQATSVFAKNWQSAHATNEDGSRKYRYIVNSGSSRSSKTYSIIQLFYLYALQNPNKKLSVFRDTKQICKQTVFEDMKKAFPSMAGYSLITLNVTESIFKFPNGSSIHIEGTDDEIKIHGYHCDVLWINEGYAIGKNTFDQLDMRCRDFVLLDLNPRQAHWSDDLVKSDTTKLIHSTFLDNPFCPPEQKIKILSYQPVSECSLVKNNKLSEQQAFQYDLLNNPLGFTDKEVTELTRCRENEAKRTANKFNHEVYAKGTKAEKPNRIFHWEEISIEQYRQIDVTRYYGVDWGTVDPWGIVEAKYLDGKLYLRELNYASENEIRQKLTPTELAQIAAGDTEEERRNQDSGGIVSWLFTKLGIPKQAEIICDTNRPLKGGALRRSGWTRTMPAVKAPGSIIDGIDLLNKLKVYYTSDSPNLKYEQENYSYAVDRYGMVMEEPEDSNNHIAGDPPRYIAQYLFSRGIIRGV